MSAEPSRIGLLVGREQSFPNALIEEVKRQVGDRADVTCELAQIDLTLADEPLPYSVLVDRISHDVECYRPYLKYAAMLGAHVVNNPFWRIGDDKFLNTAMCKQLGIAVPRTALLPSKSYGPDITSGSLRNLAYPLSWQRVVEKLGLPIYLKPYWGGGWKDVYKVSSLDELWSVYDRTGGLTMIAQESIEWTQYVRCIVIGREDVLAAPWDPRLGHFDRYVGAGKSMPPLEGDMHARVVRQSRAICKALGYDMNTVEFAIRDGVPYAIDMMNSAPDFDVSSLGDTIFPWVIERMAALVIRLARSPEQPRLDRNALIAL